MVKCTHVKLPTVIVTVILDYEGSLIRDWQRDYIQSIYIEAYKRNFGDHVTFKSICRRVSHLPIYVHFAKWLHEAHRWERHRPSKKHMIPWRLEFPMQCTDVQKKAITDSLFMEDVKTLMKNAPLTMQESLRSIVNGRLQTLPRQ